jgi:beta-galactosidase
MKRVGIQYVRIGEFAWSVIEPSYNKFNWTLFDTVLQLIQENEMKVIFGTPTATPPKWLIDQIGAGDNENSSILAFSKGNQVRTFGSRRHYKFSSTIYIDQTKRIVELIGKRYGNHPAIAGFQVDNEFGCHDTIRSYDRTDTLIKFRQWLHDQYGGDIHQLNAKWGNVFWSMTYNTFDEIDLPNLTVTEANPSHWLAFYRFSSDLVSVYSNIQVQILRKYVPASKFITTNYMGMFFDMDHYDLTVRSTLDIASWDSYPLGFTDSFSLFSDEEKIRYARTGHPDIAAFHHDLYSGVSSGGMKRDSFIVIEQQPGPVNWAQHNPSPAPGMVRLWTWEAIAHGANLVSYFRWKQAPFAQEQMHSALTKPDDSPDVAYLEAGQVNNELHKLSQHLASKQETNQKASVALLFSYPSAWMLEIQPQGQQFSYSQIVYTFYSTLREFGLDVDILRPGADLSGYKLVIVPTLPMINESALVVPSLEKFVTNNPNAHLIFGPRTGSKTNDLTIEQSLPPGSLLQKKLLPFTIERVESFRPGSPKSEMVSYDGVDYKYSVWKEWILFNGAQTLRTIAEFSPDKKPAIVRNTIDKSKVDYIAFYPSREFLRSYLKDILAQNKINTMDLPVDVRVRTRGDLTFVFNYKDVTVDVSSILPAKYSIILGDVSIKPNDMLIFRQS